MEKKGVENLYRRKTREKGLEIRMWGKIPKIIKRGGGIKEEEERWGKEQTGELSASFKTL